MTTVMTRIAARVLLLPLFMVAAAVLVKGYVDTGDGFSAGVIASLAIILQGVAFGPGEFDRLPLARYAPLATFAGLVLALSVAFVPVAFGNPILLHQPVAGDPARHFGSLEFITPIIFDVGVFLIVVGFCVGTVGAVARETERHEREGDQGDFQARGSRPRDGDRGGGR